MLGELTYRDVTLRPPDVAVLPFGATEPHNYHLPYATDSLEANLIGSAICAAASDRGARVVCLPTIPYGTETNMRELPFAMNLMPSTLLAILRDLVQSLANSRVKKCLILNSHGGNTFKGHLRELYGQFPVHLFLCNWYTVARDRYLEVFQLPDDHAGEMETSLILHARPDLVRIDQADAGTARPSRFEAVRRGDVELTRPWHKLTASTGVGDPRHASADKGKRWLDLITGRLADFLVELAAEPLDDDFPFQPRAT